MIVIEEGISNKSLAISAVATVAGLIAMVICLSVAASTPNWLQIIEAIGTLGIFGIGFLAWTGKFDKRSIKAPPEYDPMQPVLEGEPKKEKPVPKEDWAEKWLKNKGGQ